MPVLVNSVLNHSESQRPAGRNSFARMTAGGSGGREKKTAARAKVKKSGVRTATKHFLYLQAVNRNIAVTIVLLLRSMGGGQMTKKQFEREKKYQLSMALAKEMLRKSLIDDNDFIKLKGIFIRKYNPPTGVLESCETR